MHKDRIAINPKPAFKRAVTLKANPMMEKSNKVLTSISSRSVSSSSIVDSAQNHGLPGIEKLKDSANFEFNQDLKE